ncbi:MAG: PQQ-dependent sugar dehydrogenase [Enhydrobacter sp.]|nr:PQQ-dependent sugar dehydrogenase [Enhydrobacter sp.]
MTTGTELEDLLEGTSGADIVAGRGGADVIDGGDGDDVLYGFDTVDVDPESGAIAVHRLTDALVKPNGGASAPGDPDRLFVIEQHTGKIQIVDLATGAIAATPFLDIPNTEFTKSPEQGLLGIVFHPDYATNGRFYLNLTNAIGDTEIWEYTRSAADPDVADPGSKRLVLTVPQPDNNHNGGALAFGPDGYLYIALGDGGLGVDPLNNAQNTDVLLGKILRIDLDSDDYPDDPGRNYAIPADNPFVGVDGADEIWAYGLRNPWRMTFDSETGDMYIGDVGQQTREEIDFIAAGSPGGQNFGWRLFEGTLPFNPPDGVPDPSLTPPILDYGHDDTPFGGEAVIGGYVYHGPGGADGLYFFADFLTGHVWATRVADGVAHGFLNLDAYLRVDAGSVGFNTSFAVDGSGRLYLMTHNGQLFRLTPSAGTGDDGDTIDGGAGQDELYGGAGDDVLKGGAGNDLLFGGLGVDAASYAGASAGVNVSLALAGAQDTLSAGSDALSAIENLIGSSFADALRGDGNANLLAGGDGDDTLVGALGDDVLQGGAGNDLLNGNGGFDTAAYADAEAGVTVRVGRAGAQDTGGAGQDTLIKIESLLGSGFDDRLIGDAGANTLSGGGGDDRLSGDAGDDRLFGGDGDDLLEGLAGNDLLVGGAGLDMASYGAAAAGVIVDLAVATAQDTGGAGSDTLQGVEDLRGSRFADQLGGDEKANRLFGEDGVDMLFGQAGDDVLDGGAGDDTLKGGPGADLLKGGDGADDLNGGPGADQLNGGAGDDVLAGSGENDVLLGLAGNDALNGGAGQDKLTGGIGDDTFLVAKLGDSTTAAPDRITDFTAGDLVDLHQIDADLTVDGNQAFHLGATPGRTGDIVVSFDASRNRTVVDLYADGDAVADARLWLTGNHGGLTVADFVL